MSISPVSSGVIVQRRAVGSFYAASAGWTAMMLLSLSSVLFDRSPEPDAGFHSPLFLAIYGAIGAAFIFGTWAVALLPLYLLVPLHSPLWRWPVCTVCGACCGGAIMFVWGHLVAPGDWTPLVVVAAFVGGVACLFGSLTRRFFIVPVPPNNALQRTGGGDGVPPEFDY